MTVFADAFFYVAFINRRDEYHARVMEYARSFDGNVVTTQWVLAEVADALSTSANRQGVRRAFDDLARDPGTRIIEASPDHFARGLKLYDERPDKAWSLTDCISFVVMEENELSEALTGDRHFEQAGFVVVFGE